MNKGITLLVLVAVLGAMGLVLYSHSGKTPPKDEPIQMATASQPPLSRFDEEGPASPLQNRQGEGQGLAPIEPPLHSAAPPRQPEGAPVPVTVNPEGKTRPTPPPVKEAEKPVPPAKSEPEKKPAQQETRKPATPPPAKQDAAESKPQTTKAPGKEENASGAPGLEPWTVPPPVQSEQPPQIEPSTASATPPAHTPPQSQPPAVMAEQRLATDPIKPVATPDKSAHTLSAISLVPSGQGMRLRIEADSAFACKTFVLSSPDRLVIDLPGDWKGMKAPAVPQNNLIKNIRLGLQKAGPRLVLDLAGPVKQHKTERSGNIVEVQLQ